MILSLVSFSTDSRIRNADLGRFTGSDRLVGIINRLSARVEINIESQALRPHGARVSA